jgi:methylenetetrahydrofolate dehydrogenase (NADP+) / methenyltetrahydrofolate cyclohydrolase
MAMLLDGKATAAAWRLELKGRVERWRETTGQTPGLAVVLVGDDPASAVYVRNKAKAAAEAGIRSTVVELRPEAGRADLLGHLDRLAADPAVHGILVQLPLPPGYDPVEAQERVPPAKDVDGLHPLNQGLLALGRPRFIPATPLGILELLKRYAIPIAGARAVILGRSAIVGQPLATLLGGKGRDATVTLAHSRTRDLGSLARSADLLVAAIGRAQYVGRDLVRPGATVIDVGVNRIAGDPQSGNRGRLVGDVDFAAVEPIAGAISPVPGGVGPMTIAALVHNTVVAAEASEAAKSVAGTRGAGAGSWS